MTILNEAAGGALRWWREVRGWKPVAIFVLGLCLGVGTVAAACIGLATLIASLV